LGLFPNETPEKRKIRKARKGRKKKNELRVFLKTPTRPTRGGRKQREKRGGKKGIGGTFSLQDQKKKRVREKPPGEKKRESGPSKSLYVLGLKKEGPEENAEGKERREEPSISSFDNFAKNQERGREGKKRRGGKGPPNLFLLAEDTRPARKKDGAGKKKKKKKEKA